MERMEEITPEAREVIERLAAEAKQEFRELSRNVSVVLNKGAPIYSHTECVTVGDDSPPAP